MCNLYSITTNQAAIIALFRVINHHVGNLPPMPGVFPDCPAPVVRDDGGGREMMTMRWGMPPPPRAGGYPVTNIRNTSSPHWRALAQARKPLLDPDEQLRGIRTRAHQKEGCRMVRHDRPLFAFAGIWTEFKGDRGAKSKLIPGSHNVYGFLTTAPNAIVEPIHPKAMPVILTTDEERDVLHQIDLVRPLPPR